MLRAYAKYLRQAGTTFSQRYIERVLDHERGHRQAARPAVRVEVRSGAPAGEAERSEAITEEIRGQLDEVAILDHDRILRSYLGLILATLRTSFFQTGHSGRQLAVPDEPPYLVIKLDARRGAGASRATAAVRAVRLLAAAGGGAPAVRAGGAGRSALVRPA